MPKIWWVEDENGNRASPGHWGTESAARQSLKKLKNCRDCTNCYNCENCTGCSGCVNCTNCINCHFCASCENCTGCEHCTKCENLNGCANEVRKTKAYACLKHDVPVIQNIHKAVFQAALKPGALCMGAWRTSRVGLIVALAGDEGRKLQNKTSTSFAGMAIAYASDPENPLQPTRFYNTDQEEMADMARLAARPETRDIEAPRCE